MDLEFKQFREIETNQVSLKTQRYTKKISNLGKYPIIFRSQKLGDTIEIYADIENSYVSVRGGESFLEDSLINLVEQAKNVTYYIVQGLLRNSKGEFKKLSYTNRKGRVIEWVPDVCVLFEDGEIWVIECKPVHQWYKNRKKLKRKWDAATEECEEHGWKFFVFSDTFKKESWRVENIHDLRSQIQYNFYNLECMNRIMDLINGSTRYTIKQLQDLLLYYEETDQIISFSNQEVLASIFRLIYDEKLFIKDEELSITSSILYKNKQKAQFIPLRDWLKKYSILDNFRLKDYSLKLLDEDQLTKHQKRIFKRNKKLIKEFEDGVPINKILSNFEIGRTMFWKLRKQYYDNDKDPSALIPKSRMKGRKRTTLFSYNPETKSLEFDLPIFEKIIEYYESDQRSGKEKTWIEFKRLARRESRKIYGTDISYWKLRKENSELPSKHIFMSELNRYIDEFSKRVSRKRKGNKIAQKENYSVHRTTPNQNYIGQLVQIDHSKADILPVPRSIYYEQLQLDKGEKSRKVWLPRPNLTILEDIHTRVIVGYALRYEAPSKNTNFLALRRTVLGNISPFLSDDEKEKVSTTNKILQTFEEMNVLGLIDDEVLGEIYHEFDPPGKSNGLRQFAEWWDEIKLLPRTFHSDRGSDFTAYEMKEWAKTYEVEIVTRPVGGSHFGGHVERLLGVLNRNAFHTIPGTTKSNPDARGDYKSEQKAVLTYDQIEALLLLEILRYHLDEHSELGMTPHAKWMEGLSNGHNLNPLTTIEEKRKFAFDTLDSPSRMDRKTNTLKYPSFSSKRGIKVNNIWYNYERDLTDPYDKDWSNHFNHGDQIRVKWDSNDIRFVWWYNPNKSGTNKIVRVWAQKIKLGTRTYSKDQLQRSSMRPIAYYQYKDENVTDYLIYGLKDDYQEAKNRADNVIGQVHEDLPSNKKERNDAVRKIARKKASDKDAKETELMLADKSISSKRSKSSASKKKDVQLPRVKGWESKRKR